MKENLFSLNKKAFALMFILFSLVLSAQINLNENFDSAPGTSLPNSWGGSGFSIATSGCSGKTPRYTASSSSPTANMRAPMQTSNGMSVDISFNYKIINTDNTATSSNFGKIEVQYALNGSTSYTTFHTISTNHNPSTSCAPIHLNIPAGTIPSGNGFTLRFLATWAIGNYNVYIDDVSAVQSTVTPPQCNTNLTAPLNGASNVPVTTNRISWSIPSGVPTGYYLSVGTTSGASDIINNVNVGNVTSYPISLNYATTYFVRITPYNSSGNATGCTEKSFTTETPLTKPMPWNENFATTTMPLGWVKNNFILGTNNRFPASDGNYLYRNLNNSNTTHNFQTISVGTVDAESHLTFKYRLANFDGDYDPPLTGSGNFVVAVSTDYGLTYTNVSTVPNNGLAGWQDFEMSLAAYAGKFVKIKITANRFSGDYYIAFDTFYIGSEITCPAPQNLLLNFAGDDYARISWDPSAGSQGYNWFVYTSGANPQTSTPLFSGTVPNGVVNISGLNPGTQYDFYVESNCGATNGISERSQVLRFQTGCPPTDVFPFTETFESDSNSVDCWKNEAVTGTTRWILRNGAGTGSISSAHSGVRNALFYFASYAANQTKFVSPPFDLTSVAEPKLKFWYANEQGSSAANQNELRVYYKTSLTGNWILIPGAIYNTNVNSWTKIELDLPNVSDEYFIAFEGINHFGNGIVIDDLTVFDAYTCPSTTWDGLTWSNGLPDIDKKAIIDGELILNSDLSACELELTSNGKLEIPSGFNFTVNGLINNQSSAANFIVHNDANLIQIENTQNIGSITVLRNSNPMRRLDYTFWSSPVTGQNLFSFSPETVNGVTNYPGSTGRIYVYNGTNGYENPNPYTAETEMNPAVGYLFRAPNNYDATNEVVFEGTFSGMPTNGNQTAETFAGSYTSVGNPYPSNIDVDAFFAANPQLETLHFWNNNHNAGNNYATCVSGECVAAAGGGVIPNGTISVGQGFLVKTSGTAVNFDNHMRTTEQGAFSRNPNIEKHRFRLNLNDEQGNGFNQILVSYTENATNGIDHQIDGKQFGSAGSSLYNLIEEDKFVIQGRALPFENTDTVPLGFKAEEAGRFQIVLDSFDGLFAEGQTIYLKDKELNIQHNLSASDYEFESDAGEFNERFEIVYKTDDTMGNEELASNSIQIYTHNQNIIINSKSDKILSVELYDLSGRNLFRNEKVNSNHYEFKSVSKGVLVVKVQTENGEIVSKKVISK